MQREPHAVADRVLSFGPFQLFPAQQLLMEGAKPVRVGSRALDILVALVDSAGEIVSKEELFGRVWPDTFVEEGNLRVHIAALRRALGDGQAGNRYLATIPGRGYQFVAPVATQESEPAASQPRASDPSHNLPVPLARMLGRDEIVGTLIAQLPQHRFVTIVGPGGIGKTTVALAAADRLAQAYEHNVWFVDFAPLANPAIVASTVASALGLAIHSDDPIPGLIAYLRHRRMLLVLDCCEHVIESAAAVAEAIYMGAPGVHILATSREPLRAEGEHVQRLSPLETPESIAPAAAEALTFPSVQLFVERAAASVDGFELTDAEAPIVAEICRRLDGIALAIELAAGRVDAFGVRGIAAQLDDRFNILTHGRRTALPRHQTLGAALDWSYEILPEIEQTILCRLAVFAGDFDLAAASAVVAIDEIAIPDTVDRVANLVAKSLVAADAGGDIAQYRLFDTTRAYALEKLRASGEFAEIARAHAEYYRDLFERVEASWGTRPKADWLKDFRRHVDNVRIALDWAFSPEGDQDIALALILATVPLWTHLSLAHEGGTRFERALALLPPPPEPGTRLEMRLRAALGWSLMQAQGPVKGMQAAWTRALEIARSLDDTEYRLRANLNLWIYHFCTAEFRTALQFTERSRALVDKTGDRVGLFSVEHQMGIVRTFLGELAEARRHLEWVLSAYQDADQKRDDGRMVHDQRSSVRSYVARVLWLQGFPDQAVAAIELNIADSGTHENAFTLGNALVHALPVAFQAGDLVLAERLAEMLHDTAVKHALASYHAWARGAQAMLLLERGDFDAGLDKLETVLEDLRGLAFVVYYLPYAAAFADGLSRAGRTREGLAAIEDAVTRCERTEELWHLPELLRLEGELILRDDGSATAAAENRFIRSLDLAERQQALSWQLRTATSLASLRLGQSRLSDARAALAPIHARFTEGFGTPDLIRAATLLKQIDT